MSNAFDAKRAVGEALAELREKRGLTKAELARRVGKSSMAITHYENGERTPDPETLRALTGVLSAKPSQLWRRVERAAEEAKDALK